jgi:Dolichyl-phosphate-mannose-protein mannosyltransferase
MKFVEPDGLSYSLGAIRLLSGRIALDSRAPLFQMLIAFSFAVFGRNLFSAVLFPQMFGISAMILTFALADHLYDRITAFVATILVLTNLPLDNLSALVLRDSLLCALVLAALYLALECSGLRRSLSLGVVLGLLYWSREDMVAIVIPLAIYLYFERNGLRSVFAMLASSALVASPWAFYSSRTFGTLTPSKMAFGSGNVYSLSTQTLFATVGGVFYGINLLPSTLTIFASVFLIIGMIGKLGRKQLLLWGTFVTMLIVDSTPIFYRMAWPMPWDWSDATRFLMPAALPLLIFSANGLMSVGGIFVKGKETLSVGHIVRSSDRQLKGLLLVGILLFGAGYFALWQSFRSQSELPYDRATSYLISNGITASVMSFHPDMLRSRYQGGLAFAIPAGANLTTISEFAQTRRIHYLLIGWDMTELNEDTILLLQQPSAAPFRYVMGQPGVWALYYIAWNPSMG